MICPQCYSTVPTGATECPACNTAFQFAGIATTTTSFFVERAVSRKLSEEENQSLLKKMEESDKILSQTFAGQLAYIKPDELDDILGKLQADHDKDWERNVSALAKADLQQLQFEGLQLQHLISDNKEITNILNVGLKLLAKKKYAEAAEWWSLQRGQPQVLPQSKAELLYLLMEMFTYRLDNQLNKINHLIQQIRQHSKFGNSV
ncbi:hypothetical protein [Spirosoma sp.]|uniref:hypothetical protein n=1 Tax=Spirosoma sp. TaxID=1899569 RepID=UPI003B3B9C1D